MKQLNKIRDVIESRSMSHVVAPALKRLSLAFAATVYCAASFYAAASMGVPTSVMTEGSVQEERQIDFSWTAIDGATAYRLEGHDGSGVFTSVTEVPIAGTSTSIMRLPGDYTFRVIACVDDDAGAKLCDEAIASYSSEMSAIIEAGSSEPIDMDWNQKGGTVADAEFTDATAPVSDFEGVMQGGGGVSGGAASYSIPITLPPGRAGVQPNVSIDYSSRSGNGIAGVGWSLRVGGAISRCPKTFAQDGETGGIEFDTTNDKLCMNGQRLIAQTGVYGNQNTIYRTELDSFVLVTQKGGNLNSSDAYFEAVQPDGSINTYGETAEARVSPTGTTQTLSWLMSRMEDVSGNNHMAYTYTDIGHGEVLLTDIEYTGDSQVSKGDRKVSFVYQDRGAGATGGQYSTSYVDGAYTRQTRRLHKVETYYADILVRDYTLAYTKSEASSRSLLQSVQECGYEGTEKCRDAATFVWEDAPVSYKVEPLLSTAGDDLTFPVDNQGSLREINVSIPRGDLNGDGVRDWPKAFVNAEGVKIADNNANLEVCTYSPITYTPRCIDADFNLDGRTDSWNDETGVLRISYSNDDDTLSWIPTEVSLAGNFQLVNLGDYNGDGWPDAVVFEALVNANLEQSGMIVVYLHTQDIDAPYTLADKSDLFSVRANQTVEYVGDMNADGLADFAVRRSENNRFVPELERLLLTNVVNGLVDVDEVLVDFDVISDHQVYDRFSMLIDVNGDGLSDWLGWQDQRNLVLKLNQGDGSFGNNQVIPYDMPSRSAHTPITSNTEPQSMTIPMFIDAFKQMDIDGDGRAELLMPNPGKIVAPGCHTVDVAVSVLPHTFESQRRCGLNVYDSYKVIINNALVDASLPSSRDYSVYEYLALSFEDSATGQMTLSVDTTTGIYGSANHAAVIDSFGKGLPDMVFNYGCTIGGCDFNPKSDAAPSGLGNDGQVYVTRNYGSGDGTTTADYHPVDMMVSVQNGAGVTSEWAYLPLSSGQSDNFYTVDHNNVVDDEHFPFASSMYAVSEFKQSNGVGGLNTMQYQYRDAVYNTQGRGFRGFKTIIDKDVTRGTETRTDFMQMFPYSSLIERQVVYTTGGALLSKVENDWAVNAAHGGMSSDIFSVFNTSSDTYHYDLAKNVSLGAEATKQISKNSRTVAQANIDAYGNVTSETQVLEDKFITLTTITTSVYAPDDTPEGWWPNRMTSSTVARSITYKQGQVAGRDPGTQTDKTVTTHIAQWNEMYRKPQDVTVAPGASALTMDECNVDNLNACQSTVTSYNVHGLPTQVDVKGAKLNGSADTQTLETRTTTTNYTNDGTAVAVNGYFPRTIGQVVRVGSSLTQSITTNPRTGLPLSATDASGVTVTTAYDALARPISVSTTGFPTQYIGYMTPDTNEPESTNGIPVDPDTIMMVLRRQAGAPESAEYINRLGQTVRTRSKDFSGTNVFQDMRYDNLGRMTHESNVYRTDAERAYTQYTGFDVLNRPSSKVVQASESGESVTSAYAYDDFKTTVTVTPSAGDENGKTLTVKREVNSLGQLMEVHDANSTTEAPKTTQYAYDGAGNPIVIKDAANNSIFANYDDIGRKVWVKDPNQGQTHFVYNDFGELERETSGIGDNVEVMGDGPDGTENDETISYDHDRLGRVTARRGDNQTSATFRWDLNKDGLIAEEESGAIKKEYEYDSSARPTTVTTTIEGNSYAVTTAYDSEYGRPKSMTYPNNLTVALTYNAQGYLSQESNAQSNYVYRTITKQDAWGNITAATLTNETLSGTYAYSARTGQMTSSVVKLGTEAVHDLKYTNYDAYGNVITQTNDAVGASETFAYDTLHRLTKSTLTFNGSSAAIDYAYDAVGNLKKKSDYSADNNTAYSYKANTNQLQRVALKDGVTDVHFGYDIKGNLVSRGGAADDLTLENTYNAFNKPTRINRLGSTVNLSYGADLMRYKQVRTVNNETITTYYIDKVFEVELSGSGSDATREETTYLGDMAVLIELTKSDGTAIDNKIRFTHKDRLGSSATFTDHNGEVTTRRSYDPFGAPKGGDWAPLSSLGMAARLYNNGQDMDMPTRRGYTDHEHLDEVEIIHMNGRVYDYNVGRFLSVDPVIVDPTNTQAINPYSYVMNNPLSYTDPSGYATEVIEEKVRISQAGSRLKKTVGTKTTTTTTDDVTGKVTNVTTETVLKSGDVGVQSTNFDDNGAATSTTLIGGNLNSGTFGAVTIMSQESGAKSSPNLGHDSTADFRRDPCQQASCRTGIQNPSDNRTLTQIDEGLENLNSYVSTVAGGFGLASVLKSVVTKIGKEGVRLISKLRGKEGVSENLTNHGLTYDPRVRRRAVEDGIGHNFPYSFDDSILGTKGVNLPRGATGYLVRGFHNGKDVVFNIVVKENVITHRDFVNVKNWPQRNRSFSFNTELENIPRL